MLGYLSLCIISLRQGIRKWYGVMVFYVMIRQESTGHERAKYSGVKCNMIDST